MTLKLARKPDSNITDDVKQDELSEGEEKGTLEEQGKDGIKKAIKRTDSLSEKGLAKTQKIPVDNSGDNETMVDTAEVGTLTWKDNWIELVLETFRL